MFFFFLSTVYVVCYYLFSPINGNIIICFERNLRMVKVCFDELKKE